MAGISSEIDELKVVVVRRPGKEFELVTPSNMEELLFDDIVDLPKMQEEHDTLVNVLKTQNVEVINIDNLILEVLKSRNGKAFLADILKKVTSQSDVSVNSMVKKIFENSTAEQILSYLITGEIEIEGINGFKPAPNFIFTRDIGCIAGNLLIPARAFKKSRLREMIVAQGALCQQKSFSLEKIPVTGDFSIEGGDIAVLSKDIIPFGISERTNIFSVKSIMPALFDLGFKNILTVNIGKSRSCMHLDTVFTMINHNECLIYEPIILGSKALGIAPAQVSIFLKDRTIVKDNLLEALSYLGLNLNPILCGGTNPIFQQREQWTDGANALAIRPGHIIIYARNYKTIAELRNAGYEVIRAEDVHELLPTDKKFVIILRGYELSRGRGGSHCLTFPLLRLLEIK